MKILQSTWLLLLATLISGCPTTMSPTTTAAAVCDQAVQRARRCDMPTQAECAYTDLRASCLYTASAYRSDFMVNYEQCLRTAACTTGGDPCIAMAATNLPLTSAQQQLITTLCSVCPTTLGFDTASCMMRGNDPAMNITWRLTSDTAATNYRSCLMETANNSCAGIQTCTQRIFGALPSTTCGADAGP